MNSHRVSRPGPARRATRRASDAQERSRGAGATLASPEGVRHSPVRTFRPGVLLALTAVAMVTVPASASETSSITVAFDTPGDHGWTVPADVTEVTLVAYGAQGGADRRGFAVGGRGGRASAMFAVTPGETLQLVVGGQGAREPAGAGGAGGFNGGGEGGSTQQQTGGGGGGGASDVRRGGCAADLSCGRGARILVAGGGGGGGGAGVGNALGHGGEGGGLTGEAGHDGMSFAGVPLSGGGGGTQDIAGQGGRSGPVGTVPGAAGGSGVGGAGGSGGVAGGGGGGGGYYGGGGGAGRDLGSDAAGGGGGSGFVRPDGVGPHFSTGVRAGGGLIEVTYEPAVTTTSVAAVSATPSTYGGTTTLSTTISPAGAPGSVAFYVAGSATPATGTVGYDASTGVATLRDHAHGLDASDTEYSVGAVFTSSSRAYSDSEVTNPTALTVARRAITGSFTAKDKVYDGTRHTTVAGISLVGVDAGDDVRLQVSDPLFDDPNVGVDKEVTASLELTGAGAGNYTINPSHTTQADITPKPLTINGVTAADKPWDGSTTGTLDVTNVSLAGVVAGDSVSLDTRGATGAFASSAVGTWRIQVGGLAIYGDDVGNYHLVQPATTASITPWDAQKRGFYEPVGVTKSVFVAAPGGPPSPTSDTVWNSAKGGSTIPLAFNVYAGETEKSGTWDVQAFIAAKLPSCSAVAGTEDPVEFVTTGNTSLRYDTTEGRFVQNWKTLSVKSETCYRTTVTFADDSSLSAFFKLKR